MKTAREVLDHHNLLWTTEKTPIGLLNGEVVQGKYCLTRSDNHRTISKGLVTSCYQPWSNLEAFSTFDALVPVAPQAGLEITYDEAGELHGGRRVWVAASLRPEGDPFNDDQAKFNFDNNRLSGFILLSTDHSGCGAVLMMEYGLNVAGSFLPIYPYKRSTKFHGNHTLGALTGFSAQQELNRILDDRRTATNKVERLKNIPAPKDYRHILARVFEFSKYDLDAVQARITTGFYIVNMWDILTAITLWADYHKIIRPKWNYNHSARVNSNLFGESRALKLRAYQLLTDNI